MRRALLVLFVAVTALGMTHGFPLIDVFGDEMYFVYGPLTAMQHKSLLPIYVPYGTVTFYAVYLLQTIVLLVLFVFSGLSIETLMELVMQYPFLVYIASRILNGTLFLAIVFLAMRTLKIGKEDERPYAPWLIIILCGNLILLTFSHSGKMWITSIFLIFLTGLFLRSSARKAMATASLSFANFPLMGIFWFETLILLLWKKDAWRQRWPIIAIAIVIPILIFLLNAASIAAQVKDVFQSYLFPQISPPSQEPKAFIESFIALYGFTLLSYCVKILKTSPLALLLCLLAWKTRASIRDKQRFAFSAAGLGLYLMVISAMVFSRSPQGYFRYLLPFQIFFLLLFLSLEFRRTKLNTVCIRCMGTVSLWLIIIHTWNMFLPTTYEEARSQLIHSYNDPGIIVLSQVSELSFPYNANSARLQLMVSPDRCGNRCRYAIDHNQQTSFAPAFLSIPNAKKVLEEISGSLQEGTIVHVFYDENTNFMDGETQPGNVLRPETWLPHKFGREIHIDVL